MPHAGANAAAFRGWPEGLPASIEVWAVQPPGRGTRIRENPYHRFEPLIQDLSEAIIPFLEIPYSLFGHSLGAVIAFELTRRLRKEQRSLPARLFVSGSAAPNLLSHEKPISESPDQEFLERIRAINGTPRKVLENEELLQILLPTIRADYSVFESYKYSEERPLEIEFTVFGGTQDREIDPKQLEAWKNHTTASCKVQLIPGDHFFLQSAQGLLLRSIAQDLCL